MSTVGTVAERAGRSGAAASGPEVSVRVGVDLTDVGATRRSLERFGHRFVARVFTEHEADSCRSAHDPTGYDVASLSARFAAKEAVLKVLRPTGARPEWRAIELRQRSAGWCDVVLSGSAAQLAEGQGIGEVAVSLSHESGMAAAVACARTGAVR